MSLLSPVPAVTRLRRGGSALRARRPASPDQGLAETLARTNAVTPTAARLNDHILQDIGLTESAFRCKARKPFWQQALQLALEGLLSIR
jgi:hypothetical protein